MKHHNVRLIMASLFFRNLVFAYVIERLFWEMRSMSVQDVVATEFIYVLVVLALEIPAGILSDRLSRRWVLFLSSALGMLEFVIIALATSFSHFALAVALAGVGEVLASGTRNALIYESLNEDGAGHSFTRVLGRIEAMDSIVFVAALLAGGFLSELIGMLSLYWIAAAGNLIATVLYGFLREPTRVPAEQTQPRHSILRAGLRVFVHNRLLVSALVASIVVGSSIVYLDEFFPLHMRDVGLPVWSFGVVGAIAYAFRGLGTMLGERMERISERRGFFAVVVLLFLLAQIALGVSGIVLALALIALLYVVWGVLDVMAVARIHHASDDRYRATAESVASQLAQIVALAFGLVFALAARRGSIAEAVAVTSATALIAYLAFLLARGPERPAPE